MIWLNDVKYVKVWKVEDKGNYKKVQVSTSEKKQDGTYENSSWYLSLVGQAKNFDLAKGDTITINKGKLSNVYSDQHKKTFLNMVAWDISVEGKQQSADDFSDFNDFGSDLPF